MKKLLRYFLYPEDPLPVKVYTGQKTLTVGRSIKILLNHVKNCDYKELLYVCQLAL